MAKMSSFKKFRKLIILVVSLFADLFDFISDWLFYRDQVLAEDGLVFGPHTSLIITLTFAFCIVGSVTFVAEVIMNFLEYYKDNTTIEVISEVLTFSTLFLEDLPQIAINVHIAMCREEATNTIQIVKASAAMFEVVVKLIFIWIKYCLDTRQRNRKHKKSSKTRHILKVMTSGVLITILLMSSVVFYFTTNFHKSSIKFDSEGLEGETADKYLQGVGVFLRLNTTHPHLHPMDENQWMKLTDITNITSLRTPSAITSISCMFAEAPNQGINGRLGRYIWVRKHSESYPESLSCYRADDATISMHPSQNCTDLFSTSTNITTVSLKFTYIQPNRAQPLGDIHYNLAVTQNNCSQVLPNHIVILKYFKVKSEVKDTMTLTTSTDDEHYRFYSALRDLLDIREAWKTGKHECESTGRDSPKMDTDISTSCNH